MLGSLLSLLPMLLHNIGAMHYYSHFFDGKREVSTWPKVIQVVRPDLNSESAPKAL